MSFGFLQGIAVAGIFTYVAHMEILNSHSSFPYFHKSLPRCHHQHLRAVPITSLRGLDLLR